MQTRRFYFRSKSSSIMPIYEYSCPRCNKNFEEWLRSGDNAENQPCPVCGETSFRVLSNTSFILKGGGWFASSYGHGTSNLFDKSKGVPSCSNTAQEQSTPSTTNAESPTPATSTGTDSSTNA
jgi:putative FmdB family regulatory protein